MRKLLSRARFGSGSAALLASIGIIKRVRAADFTMKLGTSQALGAPINVRGLQCAQRVLKETNGRLELKLFPNSVLGGMISMLSQVRTGALEFLTIDGTGLQGLIPIAAIHAVGWAFKNSAQGFTAFNGELGDFVRNAIRAKGLYCHENMFLIGMKQVTSFPRSIAAPDDFRGFKIRTPPGAISVDLFHTLGASVTTMDVNEVYTALQTHVVDGQENPLVNIEFQRFYEVQRYLSLTSHMWSGYYLIGNQDSWNALPPDLRAILSRNLAVFAEAQNRDVAIFNDTLLDKLKRQSLIVNAPASEPFRSRLGPYYQRWQNEFGTTGWALLEVHREAGLMFHLAWFISRGYGPKAWRRAWPGTNIDRWMMPDLFVDLARAIERACFDYLIIEDSCNVPYTYQGSHDVYLRYAAATPKLDPAVLVPYIAQATKYLGIVPTLSTTEYPPFLLARLVNTLDHVSEGRAGWNLVTGSNDGGAQNYGQDRHPSHDTRYDMADEFTELVQRLWDSWDADAIVLDPNRDMFADGGKVHAVNFEGQYYKCRGPLNAPRSPQGHPVIVQAGGSPRGRRFAARWADTIVAVSNSVENMKSFRDDVRALAREAGRDPDSVKVLFQAYPIVDETDEAARERRQVEINDFNEHIDMHLALMSRTSGIDFSQFDPDQPLPALSSEGHQSIVARYAGRTPRSIVAGLADHSGLDLTGTVAHVADRMASVMNDVGGDGFLMYNSYFSRRYVTEITDGLVPELQRRKLVRTAYSHKLFRDNLLAF